MKWSLIHIFFQLILVFLLCCFIIYACQKLLFHQKTSNNIVHFSPLLITYFWYTMILSSIKIIYQSYLLIFWKDDEVVYSAKMIFFLGLLPWYSNTINGAIEASICLERCLLTVYPVGNKFAGTKFYTLVVVVAILALCGGITPLILPSYPQAEETDCRYFTCITIGNSVIYNIVYVRLTCLLTNVIAATSLLITVKCLIKTNSSALKQMNRNVLMMAASSCSVEIIPILIVLFSSVSTVRAMGPFALTGTTISIALSIGIYFSTFKKHKRTKQVSTISMF